MGISDSTASKSLLSRSVTIHRDCFPKVGFQSNQDTRSGWTVLSDFLVPALRHGLKGKRIRKARADDADIYSEVAE
jgi:hypothetical protein